jgi:hypothetical protein
VRGKVKREKAGAGPGQGQDQARGRSRPRLNRGRSHVSATGIVHIDIHTLFFFCKYAASFFSFIPVFYANLELLFLNIFLVSAIFV